MKKTQILTLFIACIFTFLLSSLSSNLVFGQGGNSETQQLGISQNSNEFCLDDDGNQIPCNKFITITLTYSSVSNRIVITPPKGVLFPKVRIYNAHLLSDPRDGQVMTYDLNTARQLFIEPSTPLIFDLNSLTKISGRFTLVMTAAPMTLINFSFDKPF